MTKHILEKKLSLLALLVVSTVGIRASAQSGANQARVAYTDRSGLSWSPALPGHYSNGCENSDRQFDKSKCTFEIGSDGSLQVKIEDSKAAKACQELNARLPTKSEYENLIGEFDFFVARIGGEEFPALTKQGRADMQSKFGDDMDNKFWTSSVSKDDPRRAYDFYGKVDYGAVYSEFRNQFGHSVRCVWGR